jgi:hypothetical protein
MEDDVTFCIHVKNRRGQLERTLPENLAKLAAHTGGRVGLVVLDYNSDDGLSEWLAATYRDEVKAGRMVFAHERTARFFHASKAKNLAHRIASGRLLVNLDADNFIGGTIPYLLEVSRSRDNALVHSWSGTHGDGTFGRIAISRPLFYALGGYDESFLPIGFEDRDLIRRARKLGAEVISIAANGTTAIRNSRRESMRNTGSRLGYTTMNRLNRARSLVSVALRGPVANPKGWGRATLQIDFERQLELL